MYTPKPQTTAAPAVYQKFGLPISLPFGELTPHMGGLIDAHTKQYVLVLGLLWCVIYTIISNPAKEECTSIPSSHFSNVLCYFEISDIRICLLCCKYQETLFLGVPL